MLLQDVLKNVSIIGAAGKMGCGIAQLLLQEMAKQEAEQYGTVGSGKFTLNLIDVQTAGLFELRKQLRLQITKYAEKNINSLRQYFANHPLLVSNEEIINAFVNGANDIIRIDTSLEWVKDSMLVFEAIAEDVNGKVKLFDQLRKEAKKPAYYLSNTSSIPISVLNDKCQLQGKIIGFHFYNPPPVQKLIEFVSTPDTDPDLILVGQELANKLQKKIIKANDIAGFIGNGYFIREIAFSCQNVEEYAKEISIPESIYMINRITQDLLLRPMGIFQLVDFVGIDVCSKIAHIMTSYLSNVNFVQKLIEDMVQAGIKGGQNPDGTQKNGFFEYDGHRIKGVYDLKERRYRSVFTEGWINDIFQRLGPKPEVVLTWKTLLTDPLKTQKINKYFRELFALDNLGSNLSQAFLDNLKSIKEDLVKGGAANTIDDVNAVLQLGFYHLY